MEIDQLLNEDFTVDQDMETQQPDISTKVARRVGKAKPKEREPFTNVEGGTNSQDEESEIEVETVNEETTVVAPAQCMPSVLVAPVVTSTSAIDNVVPRTKRMPKKRQNTTVTPVGDAIV